jgi:predicted neutral ceramidase superfamily lipid hydrolase
VPILEVIENFVGCWMRVDPELLSTFQSVRRETSDVESNLELWSCDDVGC